MDHALVDSFTHKPMLGQQELWFTMTNRLQLLNAGRSAHPEVSVGQMCRRVGGVDGLFAVDFNDASVLYIPHVL